MEAIIRPELTSASFLLEEITGAKSWMQTFVENDDCVEESFNDADLYDMMFADEEEESGDEMETPVRKTTTRPRLVPNSFVGENQCSICICDFDSVVIELDCKHRFCSDCVEQYLKVKIGESSRFHHRVARISRDEEDGTVVVTVINVVGVKCPHFGCLDVINDERIHTIVDNSTWDKFDSFALDQTLEKLRAKGELLPCPLGCGYFIQEDCLCVNADCRRRQLDARAKDESRRKRLEEKEARHFLNLVNNHSELFRLCPHCHAQIEKNGGCDNMFCTRCNQPFLWTKALQFDAKRLPLYHSLHSKALKK